MLVAELQHRTRNLMGVVRSIMTTTLRGRKSLDEFVPAYRDRLDALVRVNGLLSRLGEDDRITFDELIRAELGALGAVDASGRGERVTLDGPRGVRLRSGTVQTFALALHELATNALKYGALKQPGGHLTVRWRRTRGRDGATGGRADGLGDGPRLRVEWTETGVPMPEPGAAPQGGGYGRELIERACPTSSGPRPPMNSDQTACVAPLPCPCPLPRSCPMPEPAPLRKSGLQREPAPATGRLRVLVVEDDYLLAQDLRNELEDAGAEVMGPVPSVAEAMALLATGAPPDAAILDVNLGGEMVFPLADMLRAQSVPFMFVTGYDKWSLPAAYADVPRSEKPFSAERCVRILFG